MKANSLIPLPVASLLGLISTSLVVLAQHGAIQLTLKGGWASASEPVRKVQVVGSHAYLVVGESGLQVLDVSTPTNPVPLGRSFGTVTPSCSVTRMFDGLMSRWMIPFW